MFYKKDELIDLYMTHIVFFTDGVSFRETLYCKSITISNEKQKKTNKQNKTTTTLHKNKKRKQKNTSGILCQYKLNI